MASKPAGDAVARGDDAMKFHLRSQLLSPHAKNLALNFGGVLGERLVRLLVGLVVTSLLARHLGVDGFGLYNLGLSLGAMGLVVATLGLDGVVVREIARRPSRTASILRLTGWWRLGAGVAALGACSVYAVVTRIDPVAVTLLASCCLGAAVSGPCLVFQATGRARVAAFWQAAVFLGASIARIGLALSGASLVSLAAVVLGEVLVGGLVLWLVWRREQTRTRGHLRAGLVRLLARRLWREGWPWWMASISVALYTRFDQVLLHRLGGAGELGLFAAALRLTEQAQLLPTALAVPMLGSLSRVSREEERRRVAVAYMTASAIAGWVCALGTIVAGPLIIPFLFGAEYRAAVGVARLQALAMPLLFVGVARTQILMAQGRAFSGLWATLAAATISVGLNVLLIPRTGAMGAAVSALVAQACAAWLSTFFMPGLGWLAKVQTRALFSPRFWRRLSPATVKCDPMS